MQQGEVRAVNACEGAYQAFIFNHIRSSARHSPEGHKVSGFSGQIETIINYDIVFHASLSRFAPNAP
jgi:hypothetical protein